MSIYHCACGFAIDEADEFGDHLRQVFERHDDTGTDGCVHVEVTPPGQRNPLVCSCGFRSDDTPDFDDHLLLVRIPSNSIGNDGEKHVPVDTATPVRFYIPGTGGDQPEIPDEHQEP